MNEDVYLSTPNLCDANIIGYNVGVRPYRQEGVCLRGEYRDNKFIIHNYGYGGSGLTLCWGGAQEVMTILQNEQRKNPTFQNIKSIAVLGAGVIGLATAYELLSQGYQVQIYADSFSPHLTSNVAAGILSAPTISEAMNPEQINLTNRLLTLSMERFNSHQTQTNFAGIHSLIDYRFEDEKHDSLANKFQPLFSATSNVRVHFDNGLVKTGKRIKELGLDGKLFMDDLCQKVQGLGAVIRQHHFHDQHEVLALKENIIINCTSLGSRELFNDPHFIPIRGHLIYFKRQAGIDYSLYHSIPNNTQFWVKLYPWHDRLILGGVFEKGIEENKIDHVVVNKLLNYARDCFAG